MLAVGQLRPDDVGAYGCWAVTQHHHACRAASVVPYSTAKYAAAAKFVQYFASNRPIVLNRRDFDATPDGKTCIRSLCPDFESPVSFV